MKRKSKNKKETNTNKEALLTALFSLGGIYVTFIVLSFIKEGSAINDLFLYQSSLGGLYVNLLAILSVSYSKFAKEDFIHKNIYWLNLISFITIISIYAQARCMMESSLSLIVDWLESPFISVVLQIIFACLIFIIATQKEFSVRIVHKKKGKQIL